jgi:hypothetical protein
MKHKGKITIGQYNNYRDEDDLSVHIEIEDEKSGVRFLEIHMTPVDFAKAILGNGFIDCVFELRAANVGKTKEMKDEQVYVQNGSWKLSDESKKNLLAPYEVDGWVGYSNDLGNSHKIVSRDKDGAYYSVHFVRFVDDLVEVEG